MYSGKRPDTWVPVESGDVQTHRDRAAKADSIGLFNGTGIVRNYTAVHPKGTPRFGYILGETAERQGFLAVTARGDQGTLELLLAQDPMGRKAVHVSTNQNKELRSVRLIRTRTPG